MYIIQTIKKSTRNIGRTENGPNISHKKEDENMKIQ